MDEESVSNVSRRLGRESEPFLDVIPPLHLIQHIGKVTHFLRLLEEVQNRQKLIVPLPMYYRGSNKWCWICGLRFAHPIHRLLDFIPPMKGELWNFTKMTRCVPRHPNYDNQSYAERLQHRKTVMLIRRRKMQFVFPPSFLKQEKVLGVMVRLEDYASCAGRFVVKLTPLAGSYPEFWVDCPIPHQNLDEKKKNLIQQLRYSKLSTTSLITKSPLLEGFHIFLKCAKKVNMIEEEVIFKSQHSNRYKNQELAGNECYSTLSNGCDILGLYGKQRTTDQEYYLHQYPENIHHMMSTFVRRDFIIHRQRSKELFSKVAIWNQLGEYFPFLFICRENMNVFLTRWIRSHFLRHQEDRSRMLCALFCVRALEHFALMVNDGYFGMLKSYSIVIHEWPVVLKALRSLWYRVDRFSLRESIVGSPLVHPKKKYTSPEYRTMRSDLMEHDKRAKESELRIMKFIETHFKHPGLLDNNQHLIDFLDDGLLLMMTKTIFEEFFQSAPGVEKDLDSPEMRKYWEHVESTLEYTSQHSLTQYLCMIKHVMFKEEGRSYCDRRVLMKEEVKRRFEQTFFKKDDVAFCQFHLEYHFKIMKLAMSINNWNFYTPVLKMLEGLMNGGPKILVGLVQKEDFIDLLRICMRPVIQWEREDDGRAFDKGMTICQLFLDNLDVFTSMPKGHVGFAAEMMRNVVCCMSPSPEVEFRDTPSLNLGNVIDTISSCWENAFNNTRRAEESECDSESDSESESESSILDSHQKKLMRKMLVVMMWQFVKSTFTENDNPILYEMKFMSDPIDFDLFQHDCETIQKCFVLLNHVKNPHRKFLLKAAELLTYIFQKLRILEFEDEQERETMFGSFYQLRSAVKKILDVAKIHVPSHDK